MVVASGIISTITSVAAGLMMYLEGLVVIEHTVEETGRADLQALSREIKNSFGTVENGTSRIGDMINNYHNFSDYESFGRWMTTRSIAEIYRTNIIGGAGVLAFNPDGDRSKRVHELSWYTLHRDRSRHFVNARGNPSIDTSACAYPCVMTYAIPDPTTAIPGANIYNYTTSLISDEYIDEIMTSDITPGETWWSNPLIWFASDGNPYVYLINLRYLPPSGGHNILGGMQPIAKADMLTEAWRKLMTVYTTEAKIVITQVANGLNSVMLTGNFPDAEVDDDCTGTFTLDSEYQQCLKYVLNLTKEFQDLVVELNSTKTSDFHRGSSYWMMKDSLYLKHGRDSLDDIYLMWFRSISSVNGQLNRALFLFVGFAVLVASFDFMIGALEVILVAKPLKKLANSTVPLCSLDLEGANALIKPCLGSVISECQDLASGLSFAVNSLDEYKAFLPKSLFNQSECEDELNSRHSAETKTEGRSSSISTLTKPPCPTQLSAILRVGLSKTPLTAMKVKLSVGASEKNFIDTLSSLESVVNLFRGTLHPFYVSDPSLHCATWQGVSMVLERCCQAALQLREMKHHVAIRTEQSCRSGNLGTQTMRSFALTGMIEKVIGPMLEASVWLGTQISEPIILIGMDCAAKIQMCIKSKILMALQAGHETHLLSEVIREIDTKNEEWMYTIDTEGMESAAGVIPKLRDGEHVVDGKDLAALESMSRNNECSVAFRHLLRIGQANPERAFILNFGPVSLGRR